jgi:hypothetical protein
MLLGTAHARISEPSSEWGGAPTKGSVVVGDKGTVEYAVFGPGRFGDFLAENGIVAADPNPMGSGNLLYAYQIIDVPNAMNLTKITVGDVINNVGFANHSPNTYIPTWLNPGAATAISEQDANHSVPALAATDVGNSWVWNFGTSTAQAGAIQGSVPENSAILYFVAPYLPEKESTTLYSGNLNSSMIFGVASIGPQLVPEPTGVCLAVFAACGLVVARRRRG